MERLLTPEEIEEARRTARRQLWMASFFAVPWLMVLVASVIDGVPFPHWIGVVLTGLFSSRVVYLLFRRSKRIKDGLVGGFAESLSGVVGSKSSQWDYRLPWIEVDGKRIQVSFLDYREVEPGDHVSVEYFSRSDVAVLVRKQRGSVLGL